MLLQRSFFCFTLILASCAAQECSAQSAPPGNAATDPALADAVQQLQEQVKELRSVIADLRSESERYRAETRELRDELHAAEARMSAVNKAAQVEAANAAPSEAGQDSLSTPQSNEGAASPAAAQQPSESRLAKLEEQYDLLTGKIDDQYQTKVESRSKYRVRLSGLVLMDLFSNRGGVLNSDVPGQVDDPDPLGRSNSTGFSLRQSQIGLEVFGPDFAGARTRGDLQADFAGGFQYAPNGISLGLFRLRTASVHLDWPHTSIVAGQETPFFSALSPTSFASLAEPALSYAGNLWMWIPQIRVEHRFVVSENSSFTLQGGILDGLTGETPPVYAYGRTPQAGEFSRQPGYAGRIAWAHDFAGQPFTIGGGGYYSRQNWGFGRNVDAWAGTLDWMIPFGKMLGLSGEFYRGQGLGGLGGGSYQSAVFNWNPTDPTSLVHGLNTIGGWAQLKLRPTTRVEFNLAGGQDNPFANEIRSYPYSQYGTGVTHGPAARNQSGLFNVIYHPRSDLVFSAEYGHISTYQIDNTRYTADRFSLVMGILF